MPNLPVAVKFFRTNRKVLVVAAIQGANPNTLRVDKAQNMLVTLPEGDSRSVVAGWGRLIDPGPGPYQLLLAVFQYADARGNLSDEPEQVEDLRGTSARLQITITNTPTGAAAAQVMPIAEDDPDPSVGGNPTVPNAINLFA